MAIVQKAGWENDPNKGDMYRPHYPLTTPIVDLPAGYYSVQLTMSGPLLARMTDRKEVAHEFSSGPILGLKREVARFLDRAHRYQQLGVAHKRGVLCYGPPGCGKTAAIHCLRKWFVSTYGGIVFNGFAGATHGLQMIRQMEASRQEPHRPAMVLIEDVDSLIEHGHEESLLEILDGSSCPGEGIIYLFTTNKIGEIPARLKHRPSRIDTLIEFSPPDFDLRLEYLKLLTANMPLGDLVEKPEALLQVLADESEGLPFAHIKELLLAVVVYEQPVAEAVGRIRGMSVDDADEVESEVDE
jgi:AAA+ superfamily predicted ATPase